MSGISPVYDSSGSAYGSSPFAGSSATAGSVGGNSASVPWGNLLGGGASAVGSVVSGLAAASQYEAAAKAAKWMAREAKRRGMYEGWRRSVYNLRYLGQQINQFAVAGVELQDAALEVIAATMGEFTLDKLMAARNADTEVYARLMEAKNYRKAGQNVSDAGWAEGLTKGMTSLMSMG